METKNNILLVCRNCQSVIKSVKTIKETQTFTEIKGCLYCKSKIDVKEGKKTKWECSRCSYTWESDIEPEKDDSGDNICDQCEGECN